MAGGYFAFDNVDGGKSFQTMLARLLEVAGLQEAPRLLYIGAAMGNNAEYRDKFAQALQTVSPTSTMTSLNLSTDMWQFDKSVSPARLERTFAETDIVFFDAGSVDRLRAVLDKFNLMTYIRSAYDRGAIVGGICGGATLLAERIIYEEGGRVRSDSGVGLIEGLAISCHVNRKEEGIQRRALLSEALAQKFARQAIGLSPNQSVFVKDGHVIALASGSKRQSAPVFVDVQGKMTPIPFG